MDIYIGTVELFTFNYAPNGWLKCEGQLLQISQYQELFSLVKTTFGGDGVTTFALPNLKGKEPVPGMHYCIAVAGTFPPRV
jgi:microcystin-dependent protein